MDTREVLDRFAALARRFSVLFVVLGVSGVALLALLDHPHRAVLLLVGLLTGMGLMRTFFPGRPWFSSRNRIADAAVFFGLAALIWWFSPWTATVGVS